MTDPALSKREWFAGQALMGFFSGVPFPAWDQPADIPEEVQVEFDKMAVLCVQAADAVQRELGRPRDAEEPL